MTTSPPSSHLSLHPSSRISLGVGKVTAVYKKTKASKSKNAVEIWSFKVEPLWTKDYEKIQYNPDAVINSASIELFMKQWVNEDQNQWKLQDNMVGVEINFNQVFPRKIEIRSVADILADLQSLGG